MQVKALILGALVCGCFKGPVPPDASLPDASADSCDRAAANVNRLGCLYDTTLLLPACQAWVADGRDTMGRGGSRAECMAQAATCTEVRQCR